jgi:hypothetical protein
MGWTCDALHTTCTFDAAMMDYLQTVLQGIFFIAGGIAGMAIIMAVHALWPKVAQ